MAYSDYGAFAFTRIPGGQWQRATHCENTTLCGGRTDDRILHAETGLQLDVIIHAAEQQAQHPELSDEQKQNWYGAQHAVLGEFDGMAALCYKQPVQILWHGAHIGGSDWDTNDGAVQMYVRGEGRNTWRARIQTTKDYSIAHIASPDGRQWAAFTGFGLGDDHFWQDDEGYALDGGGNRTKKQYPRAAYFLAMLADIDTDAFQIKR